MYNQVSLNINLLDNKLCDKKLHLLEFRREGVTWFDAFLKFKTVQVKGLHCKHFISGFYVMT